MPNWTTNALRVYGNTKDIAAFLNAHIVDNDLDFNTILPEPQTIDECPEDCIVNSNSHIEILEDKPWFDWYKFHWKVWGVKWNASNTYIALPNEDNLNHMDCDLYIQFNTPWNPPMPVIDELARIHPELNFVFKFVEEQGPLYTGEFKYSKGDLIYSNEPTEYSKDAYEIMFDLWGNEEDYDWDEENKTYKLIPELDEENYVFDEYSQSYVELDEDTKEEYWKYIKEHDQYISMNEWYNKYISSDKEA